MGCDWLHTGKAGAVCVSRAKLPSFLILPLSRWDASSDFVRLIKFRIISRNSLPVHAPMYSTDEQGPGKRMNSVNLGPRRQACVPVSVISMPLLVGVKKHHSQSTLPRSFGAPGYRLANAQAHWPVVHRGWSTSIARSRARADDTEGV